MELKTEIVAIIEAFSKTNKVSRAKTQALVTEILAASGVRSQKRGRPVKDTTVQIKDRIVELREQGNTFTAKEIAEFLNVSIADVNNTVRALEFTQVGFRDRQPGERGRREIIWG